MKITNLAQLAPRTQDYTITDSVTGEEFTVTLRDLLPDELSTITAHLGKKPKPRVVDFRGKDAAGNPIPVYDEDDPQYIEDLSRYNNDYVRLWLLQSLVIEYPEGCETAEQKMEALRKFIPSWAFRELRKRLMEINGLQDSDVAYAKKKSRATPATTANLPASSNGHGPEASG